ncbi:MAG TPA: ribosome maturation factor RimM [Blastocatellia bacterium]|nr:ribosome maturation factor RimM [Blastocatellia bacterium]
MTGEDYNEAQTHEDVVIARIVKARGIKGEVACDILTDFPERFQSVHPVTVSLPGGERLRLTIQNNWFHKGRVVLKFEGYDTMSAAEQLVGASVLIAESAQMALEEGEFYEHEIVGSRVTSLGGRFVGRVTRLMRTGGTDLLVVEGEDAREHLIPFTEDICTDVDVKGKLILIRPPEGLLDL